MWTVLVYLSSAPLGVAAAVAVLASSVRSIYAIRICGDTESRDCEQTVTAIPAGPDAPATWSFLRAHCPQRSTDAAWVAVLDPSQARDRRTVRPAR